MLDKHQLRDKKIQAFNKIFNLIRTECAGVIFTSVMFKEITNYFRERIKYRVHIINDQPMWSIAKGYIRSITPYMQEIVKNYGRIGSH